MNKWWLGVCILLLATSPLYAQIKVEKSAGVETAGAQTKLILQTMEPTTPLYLVSGESSMVATGSGVYGNTVSVSGSGVSTKLICEAPAELTLDGGTYQFQLTKNVWFNGRFKVNATGGTQVWEVKQGWGNTATPFIMSGIVSLILGPFTMIFAADMEDSTGLVLFGGGVTTWGVIASYLGFTNKPRAKLIETR